jgi:Bacterial alpha-L-rhamnosidase C-terminal domain/Bacterial alpha-L-rhamnosidase 6 hairpin glycosidase domain
MNGRMLRRVVTIAAVLLVCAPAAAAHAGGTFSSSDPLLNRIWTVSVKTATDMVVPGPLLYDSMSRKCPINLHEVIIDGVVRDRCPYIGDEAVSGLTLLDSTPSDVATLRSMIVWFANAQHGDGAIPCSPIFDGAWILFDYNAYWIEDLYNFVLWTGDTGLATEVWGTLVRLLNNWYPTQTGPTGLLRSALGARDYAFVRRRGKVVAYYNAQYVRALQQAAWLAGQLDHPALEAAWLTRASLVRASFNKVFWDPAAGAYRDTPTGPIVHPEDGNAFAILAGLASPAQARSALDYLSRHTRLPYGNAMADDNVWQEPRRSPARERVYPFIGYFDVLARYKAGLGDSALELIRREWGWMVTHAKTPPGMWELIGPHGGGLHGYRVSYDSGWASGAAPALTEYVLGVQPTSPGFATFTVTPHPGNLSWARGRVPTPSGYITVSWRKGTRGKLTLSVQAPPGERWTNRRP